jgi:uncharacterized protein (TIGR02996 family)
VTSDEAFRADICERPEDDTPRLIYADWLDDHGRPERAELIRVQCALARLPPEEEGEMGRRRPRRDARWARLKAREDRLLAAHQLAWQQELPGLDGVTWGCFERGFVSGVLVADVEALQRHGEAIFRAAPVTAVRLNGRPSAYDVAECAALASVRRLTVTFEQLHSGVVDALNSSPYLAGLEELHLGRLDQSEVLPGTKPLRLESLREVTASADLTTSRPLPPPGSLPLLLSLTALDLSPSSLSDCGAEVLALSPYLANLKALDLSDNRIETAGLRALTRSPYLAGLHYLNLSGNYLEPEWGEVLAASPFLTGLRGLDLNGTSERDAGCLEEEGLGALLASPNFPALSRLGLCQEMLRVRAAEMLAGCPHLGRLAALRLDSNEIGPDGATALAASPYLGSLSGLSLRDNVIGPHGAAALAAAFPRLTALDLHWNRIGPDGAAALASSPLLADLSHLHLGADRIGDDAVAALASSPAAGSLYSLDVGQGVAQQGAEALLRSASLPWLTFLAAEELRCNAETWAALRRRFLHVVAYPDAQGLIV